MNKLTAKAMNMDTNTDLSYDVAVIEWITSCHKNHMTKHVITLWHNLIENVCVNNAFSFEIMFNLKAIKSHCKGSYDKQNLTLMIISCEIYETCQRFTS